MSPFSNPDDLTYSENSCEGMYEDSIMDDRTDFAWDRFPDGDYELIVEPVWVDASYQETPEGEDDDLPF